MEKEQILLTRSDLAKRWGISTATVDRRAREGFITPVKGQKVPLYNLYDILRVEGTDTSKLSVFERRKLEREIEELKKENEQLKERQEQIKRGLAGVMAEIAPIFREK